MSSFGVNLPLTRDSADGFTVLKTIKHTLSQNLKMLILTNPGEKVMDVNYGVGINSYLFSSQPHQLKSEIEAKIKEQVKTYMPVITILEIDFKEQLERNTLAMSIIYRIPDLNTKDILTFAL
jgi:phage baseplate assembly protein W